MKRLTSNFALFVIVLVHILVLVNSIFFPYPEFFVYPYLTNISLTPYLQILDQHFPGLMFFPVNLASLGFTTVDHFRFLQVAVVILVHFMLNKIAFKISNSLKIALVANILFFAFHPFLEGGVFWIDSFLPLLLLPVFYLLTSTLNAKKAFTIGFLLGLSVLLKQVAVVLAALVAIHVLFFRKKEQAALSFILGAGIPALALLLFVIKNSVWSEFVFWTITFNLTTYAEMGRKYATLRELLATGVIYLPALFISVYGFFSKRRDLILLSIFFVTSLLYAYARFDYVHLQPSLVFAILLLVCIAKKIPKKLQEGLFVLYLIPVVLVASRFYIGNFKNEVKFFGEMEYKVARKVEELTNENDAIFMFGTLPHMYQMTKTRPPGNVFVFQFPWFMNEAEPIILQGLKNEPPKVVVRQKSATIDKSSLVEHMKEIEEYISSNYEKIDEVGDIEILVHENSY